MRALVALGGNVGDRAGYLAFARRACAALPGTTLEAASAIYETAPVGGPPQGPYLNAAVVLATELDAHALLGRLAAIERSAGRARGVPNGPRTLDLDLVLYGDAVIDDPELTLPHPRFAARAFVLAPASDVAADWDVPGSGGRTVAELRALPAADDVVRVRGPEEWT